MTNNESNHLNPVGRFMVAVGALIQNKQSQILLLQRSDKLDWHPAEWEIPYGRLAQFEDPKKGLMREIKEEVGIDIIIHKPLTAWHMFRGAEKTANNELIGITFLCSPKTNEVKISTEHQAFKWASFREAQELVKVAGILRDIEALIKIIPEKEEGLYETNKR